MIKRNPEILHHISEDFNQLINDKDFICWERKHHDFSFYLFTYSIDNSNGFTDTWEDINNAIAYEFQAKLDKQVEIWNIYLIFLSKDPINKSIKYQIEQNKYSSRKLVFDGFAEQEWLALHTGDAIGSYLENKLFTLSVLQRAATPAEAASLEELLQKNHASLLKIISNSTTNNYPKIFFDKYLEDNE